MADFCQQCSIKLFGEDCRDLAGLCADNEVVAALCEGCGFVSVDSQGRCQGGEQCLEHHQPPTDAAT